jgi:hypothetical protein
VVITLPGEEYTALAYDEYSLDEYSPEYTPSSMYPAESLINKNYGYGVNGKVVISPLSSEKVLAVKTVLHDVIDIKSYTGDYVDVYPIYTLKDKNTAYLRLIEEASFNARKQAEGIANATKMHLGKVLSVTVGNTSESYDEYGYSSYQETAESFFGYMNLGENEYYQTVTVTYEVK